MKKGTTVLIVGLLLISTMSMAWDEVTHSYMTDKIIGAIKIPELKQLLERNKNEFLSGSWLTDTYQYTHNRDEGLNPHNLDIHCNAYIAYLQKEEVKKQVNYEQLVALFFGSVAHTTEDFWLDNILYEYPKTIGENITGDTFNGVISINGFGYLCKKVKPYFPVDDMYKMYNDAGILGPVYIDKVKFKEHYKELISKQYEQLRLLKFLSFIASNQVQDKSPWMTANIRTVTGGMLSSVNNSARYLEAVWQKLNNQQTDGLLNVEYSAITKRLGVLIAVPYSLPDREQLDFAVVNSNRDTLKGELIAYNFGGTKTNLVNLVYKFDRDSLMPDKGDYFILLRGKNVDDRLVSFSFKPNANNSISNYPLKPKSYISTLGAGLFLFIICLSLSGLFWGLSGIYTFYKASKNTTTNYPIINLWIKRGLQLVGIIILFLGIYLFITKGWIIIMNV